MNNRHRPSHSILFIRSLLLYMLLSLLVGFPQRGIAQLPPYSENDQPLHEASKQGNLAAVKQLLAQGADINARDRYRMTPLMWVVARAQKPEHLRLLRFLLDNGADPHSVDGNGDTTMMIALNSSGRSPKLELTMINLLLAKGLDVNARDKWGSTVLHSAACGQGDATVRRLLKAGANLEARTLSSQWTPLLLGCARRANARVIKALLDAGADTKAVNSLNQNALELAANNGNEKLVEVLLHAGFAPDHPDDDGITPLMLAVRGSYKERLATVRLFLRKGADINHRDKEGFTPLMHAISGYPMRDADTPLGMQNPAPHSMLKLLPMVKLLLEKGADINARNNEGKTALTLAQEWEDARLVAFLQHAGATR